MKKKRKLDISLKGKTILRKIRQSTMKLKSKKTRLKALRKDIAMKPEKSTPTIKKIPKPLTSG